MNKSFKNAVYYRCGEFPIFVPDIQPSMYKNFKYNRSTSYYISMLKTPLTYLMGILLIWLLNVNYLLYDNVTAVDTLLEEVSESSVPSTSNPTGPDEKSPNAPFSFNEEYIHENEFVFNHHIIDEIYLHKIQATELIELVHYELWSPPPEQA